MGVLGVVLAQQVLAIVVAARRTHHRVDVVTRGRVIVVDDAGLVVELHENDGAQDAIVERARIVERTDPGESRFAKMPLRLGIPHVGVSRPQATRIEPKQ